MIIGLAGFKRTGKDTFASYFPSNFTRMAFAEPLKMERQHTPASTTEPPR